MKGSSILKQNFFYAKYAEGFAKNTAAVQKTFPVLLLFYTVKLIRKRVASAVRAAAAFLNAGKASMQSDTFVKGLQ